MGKRKNRTRASLDTMTGLIMSLRPRWRDANKVVHALWIICPSETSTDGKGRPGKNDEPLTCLWCLVEALKR